MSKEFVEEMEKYLAEPRSKTDIARHKIQLVRKLGLKSVPSDIELNLLQKPEQKKLITKPTRTIAGVVPIAVMTSPHPCPHGKCTFCPGGIGSPFGDVPQSYTGKEPSTMRAIRNHYDPFLIVFNRLEQYVAMGHEPQKVELIVMGGTFTARPKALYQDTFMRDCFQALNVFSEHFYEGGKLKLDFFREFFEIPGDFKDEKRVERVKERIRSLKHTATLLEEQEKNETSHIRCIGITVETKPDWGKIKQANTMLEQGVTKVEVGVESVYPEVVKITNRGHTVEDTLESIQVLKDLGFKINIHYMLGLPKTTREMDKKGMLQLFEDPSYRPDMLKIYPCSVAKGTPLYDDWKEGKFTAITTEDAASLIAEWKPHVPIYCRIMRILRDVPTKQWEAGVGITNLRQHIHSQLKPICRCIRCREPKGKKIHWEKVITLETVYEASGGTEVFLSTEDPSQDILLGFCRMRFPGKFLRPEITEKSAIIRELHVYGNAAALGEEGSVQHRGIGKALLAKAEEMARNAGKNKMVVISGVGVREYYKKHGYKKEGPYMVKAL